MRDQSNRIYFWGHFKPEIIGLYRHAFARESSAFAPILQLLLEIAKLTAATVLEWRTAGRLRANSLEKSHACNSTVASKNCEASRERSIGDRVVGLLHVRKKTGATVEIAPAWYRSFGDYEIS